MWRWLVCIIVFLSVLGPAWWLNGRLARAAAMQFDHYSTDITPMTVGEIDRFWPPLNDPDWTRLPPEEAYKTTRWGFTRWILTHSSGAPLTITAYESGFPLRAFRGELLSDPMRGNRVIGLEKVDASEAGLTEDIWIPTGRRWFGTIVNTLAYAVSAWLVLCGPFLLLTRRGADEEKPPK